MTKEKLWGGCHFPEALLKLCTDLLAEREENATLREENARLAGKAAFMTCSSTSNTAPTCAPRPKNWICAGASVCPVSAGTAVCLSHGIRECAALRQALQRWSVLRQRLLQPRAYRLLHAGDAPGQAAFCGVAGLDSNGCVRSRERRLSYAGEENGGPAGWRKCGSKPGRRTYHGHEYMDLQRFAEDTRHMIIFDVLTYDSRWDGRANGPVCF